MATSYHIVKQAVCCASQQKSTADERYGSKTDPSLDRLHVSFHQEQTGVRGSTLSCLYRATLKTGQTIAVRYGEVKPRMRCRVAARYAPNLERCYRNAMSAFASNGHRSRGRVVANGAMSGLMQRSKRISIRPPRRATGGSPHRVNARARIRPQAAHQEP